MTASLTPDLLVHLWIHALDDAQMDSARIAACLAGLPPDERATFHGITHSRGNATFLASRYLTRQLLSTRTGLDPCQITLSKDDVGKPFLPRDATGCAGVAFNLAHSRQVVAVAACVAGGDEVDIGVDVEEETPEDIPSFSQEWFFPGEHQWLTHQPGVSARKSFKILWALKESHLKAMGKPLEIPLHDIRFDLNFPDITIVSENGLGPSGTTVACYDVGAGAFAAVCVRHPRGQQVQVECQRVDLEGRGMDSSDLLLLGRTRP